MNADLLLDASRTVTMAVANDGTIVAARGGFGGFFGLDIAAIVGTNVFERLTSEDADELAIYFLENVGESAETIALPVPFRVGILDDDGAKHIVDVIATGRQESADEWYWIVVIVPDSLNGSVTRSLDLEMAGADRDDVKRMLCEELAVDNQIYTTRTLLLDVSDPGDFAVFRSRDDTDDLARSILADVRDGWRPWAGIPSSSIDSLAIDTLPPRTRSAMEQLGWRRCVIAPVHVHGRLAAVLLLVGRVPTTYPTIVVKRNVAARINGLVRSTALLMERWEDRDRLLDEATRDALTGLSNGRALADVLDGAPRSGSLLFIDIDHFKPVNDTYGHSVGDQVLVTIANRLVDACRQGDVVSRVGGDEFVVLLDDADDELATTIGRRIIDAVAQPLGIDGGPERISVSVGQSSMADDEPFDAADQAMLRAKRDGRGRLVVSGADRSDET